MQYLSIFDPLVFFFCPYYPFTALTGTQAQLAKGLQKEGPTGSSDKNGQHPHYPVFN